MKDRGNNVISVVTVVLLVLGVFFIFVGLAKPAGAGLSNVVCTGSVSNPVFGDKFYLSGVVCQQESSFFCSVQQFGLFDFDLLSDEALVKVAGGGKTDYQKLTVHEGITFDGKSSFEVSLSCVSASTKNVAVTVADESNSVTDSKVVEVF